MIDQWLYTHVGLTGDLEMLADMLRRNGPRLLRAGLGIEAPYSDAPDEPLAIEVLVGEGAASEVAAVEVGTGAVELRGARVVMPVRWDPAEEGSFSALKGFIELDRSENGGARLALFGRYGFDTTELPAQAVTTATRATARRLLRAVAMEIGRAVPPAVVAEVVSRPAVLRVVDVMTPDPVTVREDSPILVATLVLLHHQIGGVPVVDADGAPVGVLSETDLLAREAAPRVRGGLAARQETGKRLAVTAGDACTRPPLTISQETSLKEAARTMLDRDVSRLIVVNDGRMVGMLSRHDVLKALVRTPAELQSSIDARMEESSITGVHAEVLAGGAVRLTGDVRDRTAVATAEHVVRALDGVTDVVTQINWQDDTQ